MQLRKALKPFHCHGATCTFSQILAEYNLVTISNNLPNRLTANLWCGLFATADRRIARKFNLILVANKFNREMRLWASLNNKLLTIAAKIIIDKYLRTIHAQ